MGVGDAADPDHSNTAIAAAAAGYRVLVDCGHSVPPVLWRKMPAPDAVDAIILTAPQPDRCFGLVPILLRWAEDGRRKPVDLAVPAAAADVPAGMLAAGGVPEGRGLPFPLRLHDLAALPRLGPFALAATPGGAVGLEWGGRRCVYGTSGTPGPAMTTLAAGCDLLFHACNGGRDAADELEALSAFAVERQIAAVRLVRVHCDRHDAVAALAARHPRLSLALPGQLIRLDRMVEGADHR